MAAIALRHKTNKGRRQCKTLRGSALVRTKRYSNLEAAAPAFDEKITTAIDVSAKGIDALVVQSSFIRPR